MKNGDRVEWKEGGWKQFTYTGTIVCAISDNFRKPSSDWFTIKVDDEHYLRACSTATEMNLHWVDRDVSINDLKLIA